MTVIIYHPKSDDDITVYGPFHSQPVAYKWACDRFGLSGPWYWLPLTPPD